MTRSRAIAYATEYFDSGAFLADLTRRVAFPTESAVPETLVAVTAGRPDGPLVPVVWRTPASSVDEPTAGQARSAVPGSWLVPGPAEKPSRVKMARSDGRPASRV